MLINNVYYKWIHSVPRTDPPPHPNPTLQRPLSEMEFLSFNSAHVRTRQYFKQTVRENESRVIKIPKSYISTKCLINSPGRARNNGLM